jgi:hypothetical protein
MNNTLKYLITLIAVSILSYQYTGCDSDSIFNGTVTPLLFGGYDKGEAGTMMTLSALCYTAEGNTNALQIRDSIILQLSDTNYATGNNWKLAWGPGLSVTGGNLMYVAVDSTSDTTYYAICVRGTIFEFADIEEDLEVWYMVPWPFTSSGDSIAFGSMKGLDTLLSSVDPLTNKSLQTFLNEVQGSKLKMYITGHSLGGAMATLVTSWFVDAGFTSKFKLESYTFAAPTVGNVSFVNSFHNKMLGAGAENHRCVNDKDVVPFAWAGLLNIIHDQVPTIVPAAVQSTIMFVNQQLVDSGIVYKHVDTRVFLGTQVPQNCGAPGSYETYFCWVGFEHSSGTYLRLLDADTINWGR